MVPEDFGTEKGTGISTGKNWYKKSTGTISIGPVPVKFSGTVTLTRSRALAGPLDFYFTTNGKSS